MEPEEFFEAGDRIVVFIRTPARGKGSGVDVVFRPAHIWTMRAGKAVRMEVVPERAEGPRSRGAVGARRSRRLLRLRDTARAMSQENVEIVCRVYRRLQRARFGAQSALCRTRTASGYPRSKPRWRVRHLPGARWLSAVHHGLASSSSRSIDRRVRVRDSRRASTRIWSFSARGRASGSGAEAFADGACYSPVRDGKVVALRDLHDRAEALEAVGLSE